MYFYLCTFIGLFNYTNPLGPVWSHDENKKATQFTRLMEWHILPHPPSPTHDLLIIAGF